MVGSTKICSDKNSEKLDLAKKEKPQKYIILATGIEKL